MEHSIKKVNEIKDFCMGMPGVYETRPFGKYPICYRIMGKIFAQLNPEEHFYKLTLKCNPEHGLVYRDIYPGVVVRGYHCPPVQQPYWNTIDLHQFADQFKLYEMIEEAYDEVLFKTTKKARNQFEQLSKMEYVYTNGKNKDFNILCTLLDEQLDDIVGGRIQREEYVQYNTCDEIHHAIVVYQKDEPIGCISFRMYDDEHAELKRFFVKEEQRHGGVGKELIRRAEAWAKIEGYKWCILETGEPLVTATHLYRKMGYKEISNYGPYIDKPASLCMQRKI